MGLLTDIVNQKVAEKARENFAAKQAQIEFYQKAMTPEINPDPKDRAYAEQQLLKLLPQDAKQTHQRGNVLANFFHNVVGHKDPPGYGQPQPSPATQLPQPTGDQSQASLSPSPRGMLTSPFDTGGENFGPYSGTQPQKTALGQTSAAVQPVTASSLGDTAFSDKPTGPSGSDANLGAAPNSPQPSPAGMLAAPQLPAASPAAAAPAPAPTFHSLYSNNTPEKVMEQRKPVALTAGLKPGTREYSQFLLLGTMPNVLRPTTAAARHAQLVDDFMSTINPTTGRNYTEPEAEEATSQRELQQKQTPVEIETTTGEKVPALQSPTAGFTHLDGSPFDTTTIAHIVRPSNAAIRVNAQEAITLQQAEALENSGAQLNIVDAAGQPIKREDIPAGMVLQAVHSGQNTVYTPRGINDKVVSFNNQRVAVNPMEVQQIPEGAGTVLGQVNTGTSTANTPTVVQRDAQGVPHVLGSTSTRVPNTPSVRGRAATVPNAPAPASASPRTVALTTAPAARGPRSAGGVLPGMDSAAIQVARPLNEASTQLFGDPAHPEFKSLSSYEKLADDPEARKRIGQALQLTFAGIEKAAGGAGASVSGAVGPVSVSTGGFGTWLQNALGVPQANAEMAQKIREQALQPLKPEEREAVNAIVDAFSAIPAIRSVTKGVATQATIEALERDVPAIGWNTMDSKTFRDKMARLGEYFYQGKKFLPGENYVDTTNIDAYLGRGKAKPSPRGMLNGPQSNLRGKSTKELLDMLK